MTESATREEILARQLHEWYLEATKNLTIGNFNSAAQKAYDELTEQQKSIDLYIAKKILSSRLVEMPSEQEIIEVLRPIYMNESNCLPKYGKAIVNLLKGLK